MDVQDRLYMQSCIQDALDELLSPRSAVDAKTKALQDLERQLAIACLNDSNSLSYFRSLQQTFECNVPLRLLTWIAVTTPKLDGLTNKGVAERREADVEKLASQLSLALSIIQGVALIHEPSKVYLGRKHALEILLDLLLVSRHVSSPQDPSPLPSSSTLHQHLSSVVLDTLLCILVDSSNSLRSFENVNGVQLVVKILKRAGTPREVRMKCLEFLYFYLMDETSPLSKDSKPNGNQETRPISAEPAPPPTTPVTPIRTGTKKPFLTPAPRKPSSRQTSSLFPTPASSVISLASSNSSRSTSNGSTGSILSSPSTSASSIASSPETTSIFPSPGDSPFPATSPRSQHHRRAQVGSPPPVPPLRTKIAQRKETDSAPSSPVRRHHVASPPARSNVSRHGPSKSMSAIPSIRVSSSAPKSAKPGINKSWSEELPPPAPQTKFAGKESALKGLARFALSHVASSEKVKSTEEKKEFLGTMLGNVDALVESVRKAGIWGLS
ncbi:Cell division control protein 14, SIN component domain containing protein [Amanita muscaria]